MDTKPIIKQSLKRTLKYELPALGRTLQYGEIIKMDYVMVLNGFNQVLSGHNKMAFVTH